MSMMAFMSEAGPGSHSAARALLEELGGSWALATWGGEGFSPDSAIREAERILAETERDKPTSQGWPTSAHVDTPHLRIADQTAHRGAVRTVLYATVPYTRALAESLAAILPVLDELAWGPVDASVAIIDGAGYPDAETLARFDRNRATLAAMDRR